MSTARETGATQPLRVREWMTRDPVTIGPTTSVLNARRLLATYGVRHLPVVSSGALVGIVSDRDLRPGDPAIAWALASLRSDLVAGRYRTVGTIMSTPAIAAGPEDTIEQACAVMLDRRVGALPVVDRGRLVGMLSLVDCLRALLDARRRARTRPTGEGAAGERPEPAATPERTTDA